MSKPATDATRKRNAAVFRSLPFEDTQDFEDVRRGLLVETPNLVLRDAAGRVIWDVKAYSDFLDGDAPAPDTVNPSYWRHERLNTVTGLFQVAEGIWQVRGFDAANMTLVRSDSGYIVIDTLFSVEAARAALDFAFRHLGKRKIVAVVLTHCHVDHFGGLEGVVSPEDVKSGAVPVIAPEGFTEAVVSENVFVGPAMNRRSCYQFGPQLPIGPRGQIGIGLGKGTSKGRISVLFPNKFIRKTGERLNVDGVEFVFQMTPDAEAPAEMCFYLPQFKALCMAELTSATLHNVLPFRGAQARSTRKWAHHIQEARELFGDESEVLFLGHHWPRWGRKRIVEYLEKQRDLYKFINDQTVRHINHGETMTEIAEGLELPRSLGRRWYNRSYYGHLSHDIKATYQHYLGWFDANPAHLDALPPEEAGRRYVEFMGGPEEVVRKARACFERGEYRWVAQVLDHVVFAFPENEAARELEADALEQLGYRTECATWRNCYLTGAMELREGVKKIKGAGALHVSAIANIPTELLLDFLAVHVDPERAEGLTLRLNLHFTESGEDWQWTLSDSVMNCWQAPLENAAAEYALTRPVFDRIICGELGIDAALAAGSLTETGARGGLAKMFAVLEDQPDFRFGIVTP